MVNESADYFLAASIHDFVGKMSEHSDKCHHKLQRDVFKLSDSCLISWKPKDIQFIITEDKKIFKKYLEPERFGFFVLIFKIVANLIFL